MIKLGNNSIGKVYLGSNEIGKAYLGSNLVYQKGGPVVTTIPYLRGGADGSYIDTGITPDSTTRVIVWARNFNPNCGALFGSRISATDSAFYISATAGANSCRMSMSYGDAGQVFPTTGTHEMYLSHYHKYEMNGPDLYVDDSLIATSTGTLSGSNHNIHIFGLNNNGTHASVTLPIDIVACKIYKNNMLVRDYTPVNSPSVGLYDAVSDTVFTNAGSGSFTYGSFNPDAYTPLEYVSCAEAGVYFDTGLKGGDAVPWNCVFTPTGTTARASYPLGAQTSSSSKRCAIGIGNTTYVNGRLYFYYQSANNTVKTTNTNNYFTNKKIVYLKEHNVATAYVNGTQEGTVTGTSGSSFVTDYNLYIGAMNSAGTATGGHIGNIYYCGLGTYRNYVPAKVNGVAGMYDTYNDTFYPSTTSIPFTAGPEI